MDLVKMEGNKNEGTRSKEKNDTQVSGLSTESGQGVGTMEEA